MAKAYSYDLRQKVVNAIELDGMKKSEAAQVFQLSRNTLNLWLKRQAETGDYQAKTTRPHRTSSKITDWDKFAEFAPAAWRENPRADGRVVGRRYQYSYHFPIVA